MISQRTLNVAVVGSSLAAVQVAQTLQNSTNSKLNLVAVGGREMAQHQFNEGVYVSADAAEIASATNVDIVVEMLSGGTKAYDIVSTALNAGKHVVTANQVLLAGHGRQLFQTAQDKSVQLRFEAAVLGGLPTVSLLLNYGAAINKIYGCFSPVCNQTLWRMHERGEDFATAIQSVVELGEAQGNLQAESTGKESLIKMALMRSAAFGVFTDISKVAPQGIMEIAPSDLQLAYRMGYRVQLLAQASTTEIGVSPCLIEEGSALAELEPNLSALVIENEGQEPLTIIGDGTSENSIAAAIMQDVMAIANNQKLPKMNLSASAAMIPMSQNQMLYLRLPTKFVNQLPQGSQLSVLESVEHESEDQTALLITTSLEPHHLLEQLPTAAEVVMWPVLEPQTNIPEDKRLITAA